MKMITLPDSEVLTTAEVAAAFRVDPKTINRWVHQGRLRSIRNPGAGAGPGHHRFFRAEVDALLNSPEAGR